MLSTILRRAGLLAALCLAPTLAARAETVVLQPVGPGAVTGLSANGLVATGQTSTDYQTFRWTPKGGVELLGRGTWAPLGKRAGIPAISGDGQVIASSILSDDGSYATSGRWTATGGWQQLAPPLPPGGGMMDNEDSAVWALSRNGQVAAGLFWRPGMPGGSAHGFAWSAATNMVDLGSDGYSSRVSAANADGSVLVGFDEHPSWGMRRAAVWVNGVRSVLDNGEWPSEALGVNGPGNIVVGQAADPANGFRQSATMWTWNGNGWSTTVLGVVPASRGGNSTGYATGVSDDGRVVVGGGQPEATKPKSVGFIWTPETGLLEAMQYLKDRGHDLQRKFDIIGLATVTPNGRTVAAVGLAGRSTAPSSLLIWRSAAP